jgi:hypothetical protein
MCVVTTFFFLNLFGPVPLHSIRKVQFYLDYSKSKDMSAGHSLRRDFVMKCKLLASMIHNSLKNEMKLYMFEI